MTAQKDMVILPNLYINTASDLQKNMLLHHSQTAGYAIKHNNSVCFTQNLQAYAQSTLEMLIFRYRSWDFT